MRGTRAESPLQSFTCSQSVCPAGSGSAGVQLIHGLRALRLFRLSFYFPRCVFLVAMSSLVIDNVSQLATMAHTHM
jgi:hypothetical protein